MNNQLIKTFMLAMLMNARTAVVQASPPVIPSPATVGEVVQSTPFDPRMTAPIGHRQPRLKDVTVGEAGKRDVIDEESAAIDRKLTICRGC